MAGNVIDAEVLAEKERYGFPTEMQARFARELASGKHRTKKDAALAAGYAEKSAHVRASELLSERNFRSALVKRTEDKRDKAGRLSRLAGRLLDHGEDNLESVDPVTAIQTGAGLEKVSAELQAKYGSEDEHAPTHEDGIGWALRRYRAVMIGIRLARWYGADGAAERIDGAVRALLVGRK